MNKKILIAFSISVFVGVPYLLYRFSPLGRKLKSMLMLRKMKNDKKERNITRWEFPEKVMNEAMSELTSLNFNQLEVVDEYVDLNLARKAPEQIYQHRDKMNKEGIYKETNLATVELILYNLYGVSTGFHSTLPSLKYLDSYQLSTTDSEHKKTNNK